MVCSNLLIIIIDDVVGRSFTKHATSRVPIMYPHLLVSFFEPSDAHLSTRQMCVFRGSS